MSGKKKLTQAEKNAAALSTDHLTGQIGRRALSGGVISIGGQLIRVVIQIGSTAIMARLLSPEEFGLVAMALVATFLVGLLADVGALSGTTVGSNTLTQAQVSTMFWLNLAAGVLVFVSGCALAPVAAAFFGDDRIIPLICVIAFGAIPTAIAVQFNALLVRGMHWLAIQGRQIFAQAIGSAIAVALVYWTDVGSMGLALQIVFVNWLRLIFASAACSWRPSLTFRFDHVREDLSFSLNIFSSNVLMYLQSQVDSIIIGSTFGAAAAGALSRARNIASQVALVIRGPVNSVITSSLSRSADDLERWSDQFLRASSVSIFLNKIICLVLFVSAFPLIAILLGPGWDQAASMLGWMLIGTAALGVSSPFTWMYFSLKKTQIQLRWTAFSTLAVGVAYLLGMQWGPVEVVQAGALCQVGVSVLLVLFALRHTTIRLSTYLPIVASSWAAAALAVLAARWALRTTGVEFDLLEIVVGSGVAAVVYTLVMLGLSFVFEGLARGRVELVSRLGPLVSKLLLRRAT
jgi:O-antigen/teichoic acid export membrane protein